MLTCIRISIISLTHALACSTCIRTRELFSMWQVLAIASRPIEGCTGKAHVPEQQFLQEKTSATGGCGCTAGDKCTTSRCRKCFGEGVPCTFKCGCKGLCGNPFNLQLPLPEKISADEMAGMPLDNIIAKLTPRDMEYFVMKHGLVLYYSLQFKLCAV